MFEKLSEGVIAPDELQMIKNVLRRMIADGYVPKDIEKQHEAGAFLIRMYFKGMVIEDKLYDLGVAMAKVRFDATKRSGYEARLPLLKMLVIEDDYNVAHELKRVFENEGAIVLGPVGRESDAASLLASEVPDLAIVDLNLGDGVNFDVAELLQQQAVPICVYSGYKRADLPRVPDSLGHIPWLEKPQERHALLEAAARAVR